MQKNIVIFYILWIRNSYCCLFISFMFFLAILKKKVIVIISRFVFFFQRSWRKRMLSVLEMFFKSVYFCQFLLVTLLARNFWICYHKRTAKCSIYRLAEYSLKKSTKCDFLFAGCRWKVPQNYWIFLLLYVLTIGSFYREI